LNQGSALRLISRDPPKLAQMFHPIFSRELLDASQLLGLSLTLQNPVRARLVLKLKSAEAATEFAGQIQSEPQKWLKMQDSDLLLNSQTPEVETQGEDVQLRFDVPENSARLLLQRIAKTDLVPVVAEK
jgi:hypothetical protein